MNGQKFLAALEKEAGTTSTQQLATLLGKASSQISAMRGKEIGELTMARMMAVQMQRNIKGEALVAELRSSLDASTDRMLAQKIGMTPKTLVTWKKPHVTLTAKKIADLVHKSRESAIGEAHSKAFQPIIEFFPIAPTLTVSTYKVFDTAPGCGKQREGLKTELESSNGLYVFYDARGKALYVGQAAKQSIWKEMHSAYNRPRRAQVIATVKHPTSNVAYKSAHEKLRQPVDTPQKLVDLAAYFSAYQVTPALIDDFEALFIRAFPNDLLNYKMEKIGKRKKVATKPKKATAKKSAGVRGGR